MKTNSKYGHLGKARRAVIDDLMNGMNKYDILQKHKVSPSRYRRWLSNPVYKKAIVDRVDSLQRQHKFIAVHALPLAVRRLGELIACQKHEIARKACLDIIALQNTSGDEEASRNADQDFNQPKISDEKAARMLEILAEPDPPTTQQQEPVGASPAPAQSQYPSPVTEQPVTEHLSFGERIERDGWKPIVKTDSAPRKYHDRIVSY